MIRTKEVSSNIYLLHINPDHDRDKWQEAAAKKKTPLGQELARLAKAQAAQPTGRRLA